MNEKMGRKVEASIPIQSRVDVRVLAEMVLYWDGERKFIKSMSQLVNWSMDLCSQILKINNLLPKSVDTILEANELLTKRGLYQGSMYNRAQKKIVRARQLENLRIEGIDPETWAKGKGGYAKSHNNNSVEPAPEMDYVPKTDRSALWAEYDRKLVKEQKAEAKKVRDSLSFDKNGVIKPIDLTNTYTAKDRLKDINEERERLGLKSRPIGGSVVTIQDKEMPKSKNEAKKLLDRLEGKVKGKVRARDKSKPVDVRPRKLSDEEMTKHEEKIAEKDRREQDAWDSISVSDLKPILDRDNDG